MSSQPGHLRVAVDAGLCQGHGRCYVLAPEIYGADDAGHCVIGVPGGIVPEGLEDRAELGAANCPERAITLERA